MQEAKARRAGRRRSTGRRWRGRAPIRCAYSILEILGIDGGRVLSTSDLSQELQIP